MGRDIEFTCGVEGDLVVATADVSFEGWVIPDWDFSVSATALKEQLP